MKSIYRAIRNIRNEDLKKQEAICFILGEEMETDLEAEASMRSYSEIEMTQIPSMKLFKSTSYSSSKKSLTKKDKLLSPHRLP